MPQMRLKNELLFPGGPFAAEHNCRILIPASFSAYGCAFNKVLALIHMEVL